MHQLKRTADGWRGVIGEQFSIPSAVRLSLGIAQFLIRKMKAGTILVTHDARLLSKETALAIVQSLVDLGFDVIYGGMQSTPAASQALTAQNCIGAILVTASHNPFYWNGIKLKIAPGLPPTREDEEAIQKILDHDEHLINIGKIGSSHAIDRKKIFEGYANQALSALSMSDIDAIRKRKFKVIVDALHGVSADSFCALFHLLGCELTVLGSNPDPLFNSILPDPMNFFSRRRIVEEMQKGSYDFGFLSDGDGDRLCVLDENNNFVWPHDILGLIFEHLVQQDKADAGMAVTGPTGSITERICKKMNRKYIKTPVGFKYVSPFLQNKSALIAGGAVGEIGFSFSQNKDRDPLTSALLLLHLSLTKQLSLSQMVKELHERHGHSVYKQWTVSQMPKKDLDLKELGTRMVEHLGYRVKEILTFDGQQFVIDDVTWILIRWASTEGGMRIYAELHNREELDRLFEFICKTTNAIPEEKG